MGILLLARRPVGISLLRALALDDEDHRFFYEAVTDLIHIGAIEVRNLMIRIA